MITSVNSSDFILQSLNPARVDSAAAYILLIKAKWCGHCTRYLPDFEKQSVKFPNVKFLVLESTDNDHFVKSWSNLANPAFQVNGFPTVVLYNSAGMPVKQVADRMRLDLVL